MNTLLVGYDLNNNDDDYAPLIEAIKGLGTWWHHLDSTWLVCTELTAAAARDHLAPYLDDNDEMLVINVTGDSAAWKGFSDRGSKWLKDHL